MEKATRLKTRRYRRATRKERGHDESCPYKGRLIIGVAVDLADLGGLEQHGDWFLRRVFTEGE